MDNRITVKELIQLLSNINDQNKEVILQTRVIKKAESDLLEVNIKSIDEFPGKVALYAQYE